MTPSGEAIVNFRLPAWKECENSYDWQELGADLQRNAQTLEKIRAGLAQPVLDNQLDYSIGPKLLIPELMVAKNLTYWFGSECQLALHEHRIDDARRALLSQISLPRYLANDSVLISELVRGALGSIARSDTWEALQSDGWTDDQLLEMQQAWLQTRYLANLTRSLQGERVFAATAFEQCRKSNDDAYSLIFWTESLAGEDDSVLPPWENWLRSLTGEAFTKFAKKQVYCGTWRFAWVDQSQVRYSRQIQSLIEISRAAEQTKSWTTASKQIDLLLAKAENKNFYDELRFPTGAGSIATLSRAINKAMRLETERSLIVAAIALKRYALKNASPPSSLNELAPALLDSIPIDYMDGKPLKYRLDAAGWPVLYSVGEDGIDDGGDLTLLKSTALTAGWWSRKDVVWPNALAQ
ncbi:MAG TPA: hypothetical protein VL793_00530 [Patescibacteria group bacterium]|nr:hypothetical protein [Patescibacteria group bacterium]